MDAIFNTKMVQDLDYNNKKCVVLRTENIKGCNYYTIKFEDGHIIRQVYECELIFGGGINERNR